MSDSRTANGTGARIRDTLSGQKLAPALHGRDGPPVSIYLCGVTVYDDAHIGHARTIVTFDVLRRHLRDSGIPTRMIQNFTDVDDKIIARAHAEGLAASDVSSRYIGRYYDEFDRLNVLRADAYPKATEHMPEIISFITDLMGAGAAYASRNGVYFAVSEFSGYGKLSKKNTDDLKSGARIEIDEEKRDPLDFALWKFDCGEPSWESPWGRGRPGWHIECSAMSTKYLGDHIDIHGGGRDLIFPHHENEIAQSESRTCTRGGREGFARIWMHVGMVTIRGEKMSKSLGNIYTVGQALRDWGPNVIRIFCLSGHYSKPVDYSEEILRECLSKWRQLEACAYELRHAAEGVDWDDAVVAAAGYDDGDGVDAAADAAAADADDDDAAAAGVCSNVGDKAAAGDASAPATKTKTKAAAAACAEPPDGGDTPALDAQRGFDAALDDDLNTHMALSFLMGIVSETNSRIAGGTLSAGWASRAMHHMLRMSGVLGLSFGEMSREEYDAICGMVAERDAFRQGAKYGDADRIRDLLALQNVEIIDRAGGTVWIKRERLGADRER